MLAALRSAPKTRGQDRDLIYLLQMSRKHNLDPLLLHTTMIAARRRGNARRGKFIIVTRRQDESSATYMFSLEGKPLGQAVIPDETVKKLKHLPDELRNLDDDRDDSNGQSERQISGLKYGLKGVSFKAHVVRKSEVRAVTSRDGNPLLVCTVTLSDGTGEIPLVVWNSQIHTISEGDVVQVHDARVRSFRGEIQLSLSRKTGTLTILEPSLKSTVPQIPN
jgi:hypothetical protein